MLLKFILFLLFYTPGIGIGGYVHLNPEGKSRYIILVMGLQPLVRLLQVVFQVFGL